jgi:hypothetical protein
MNELSHVEKQLRSWTPRQPSAALRAKIFDVAAASADEVEAASSPARVPAWQWLAPAMAVFVIAMMSWTDGAQSSFISTADQGTSSALNNPELAAYPSSAHSGHNTWPVTTFPWTRERHNLPAAAPVLVTNDSTIP